MLRKSIKYTDFNGEEVTDIHYFNLTNTELLNLEVSTKGGFQALLQKIVDEKDVKELVSQFQTIVLMSYGQKSEDGKRFIKNEELRNEFTQTAAYDALFMELSTDADAAANFVKGVMPKNIQEAPVQDKPVIPTAPPAPPS
jgi:hypothetical protein